ncbi:hypothetical protein [Glycomyces sp. NRRL B-16210]|uniref:hypothetical protein n=1 Tax=Glycomyces sp. NRRL B-16210 TaxID=1463821 RepID=UPI0004BFE068|nr:hypothetical protein [Glycomyces sp. NRRL B-16210]
MSEFDNEIERAVNRAGKAAGALTIVSVLMLVSGIVSAFAVGVGLLFGALVAAALIYGFAVLINLQAMHLLETWRQGRRSEGAGSDR